MVFVIAEIGINHNGNMNVAKELIRAAAWSGANAAKFQAYSVDALFGPNGEDPNEEIHKGVKPLELNKDQLWELKNYCDEQNIEFMCSVFDDLRLQWIEEMGVKRHKIASRTSKLTRDLAVSMANTGKTCYMSLGFNAAPLDGQYKNVQYLYCVSKYPSMATDIKLPQTFKGSLYTGFSDHTLGISTALAAVARGATVLEKHFTLNKGMVGFDHIVSCTPDELELMVKMSNEIERSIKYSE